MKKIYLTFICFILCAAPSGFAAEPKSPTQALVYLSEEFAPYNYQQNGQPAGLAVDILRLMWRKAQLPKQDIQFLPWARAYDMTLNKSGIVLFSTIRLPSREKLFKWVGPITTTETLLITMKGRNITINSPEDLKGLSIGGIQDYASSELLKKYESIAHIEKVPSVQMNIKKLIANRLDAIALEQRTFAHNIKELGLNPEQFEKVWTINRIEPYYAFSKDTPDKVIALFQKALDAIKATPEYQRRLDQHLQ
ncbi:MAG: transporter substrate-binding domain-containing protein [Pseudodesulfovibrio sp.]|nr:transporter substrate-binding domain-containing protein [Pseudodesulfovibrio sp.]